MTTNPESTRNAILVGAVVAVLIAIGHLYWQVDRMSRDVLTLRQSVITEITKLQAAPVKAAPSASNVDRKAHAELARLETLRAQLEQDVNATKEQASAAALRARSDAIAHARSMVRQLGDEHQNQHKEVTGELGQVRQAAHTAGAKVEEVSADVAQIKTQFANSHRELERTVAELKRVSGDLGVQSGLIATNASELAALKALGERNYFEFHIERGREQHRVGDVTVVLKKTDPKESRYTLEIVAGGKKTEKKDKTINEPLQFYSQRSRFPSEIVVNEVAKDYVAGYLASPKEQVVARGF